MHGSDTFMHVSDIERSGNTPRSGFPRLGFVPAFGKNSVVRMDPHNASRSVVLVVDDAPAILRVLQDVLAPAYDVLTAGNGASALEILRRRRVDLVILDLMMPEMAGLTVLERLRAEDQRTPVILLTGVDNARTALSAVRLGVADYITKPFQIEDLLRRVGHTLALASSRTATHIAPGSHPMRTGRPRIVIVTARVITRAALSVALRPHCDILAVPDPAAVPTCTDAHGYDLAIVDREEHRRAFAIRTLLSNPFRLRELFDHVRHYLMATKPARPFIPNFDAPVGDVIDFLCEPSRPGRATVGEMARVLGLSSRHLLRAFHSTLGLSVREYLTRVQVEAALALLVETDHRLESIADQLGFHSAAHFSRVFLAHVGTRPGVYRCTQHASNETLVRGSWGMDGAERSEPPRRNGVEGSVDARLLLRPP